MWWVIIGISVLLIFIFLLFAPFFLEINSDTGLFRIRFHRLVSASLTFNEGSMFLQLKIMGWQKQINMLEMKKRDKKPVAQKKARKKISFQKISAAIKSFRIKKLVLNIDTGNMQTNGILYPLFMFIRIKTGKSITINFLDENKLILQIENNLARMLWAFIKS